MNIDDSRMRALFEQDRELEKLMREVRRLRRIVSLADTKPEKQRRRTLSTNKLSSIRHSAVPLLQLN